MIQFYDTKVGSRNIQADVVRMVAGLYGLRSAVDIHVLEHLTSLALNGSVSPTKEDRTKIMFELDLKPSHLSNSLARLRACGLLSVDKGVYTVNKLIAPVTTEKVRTLLAKGKGLKFEVPFTQQ